MMSRRIRRRRRPWISPPWRRTRRGSAAGSRRGARGRTSTTSRRAAPRPRRCRRAAPMTWDPTTTRRRGRPPRRRRRPARGRCWPPRARRRRRRARRRCRPDPRPLWSSRRRPLHRRRPRRTSHRSRPIPPAASWPVRRRRPRRSGPAAPESSPEPATVGVFGRRAGAPAPVPPAARDTMFTSIAERAGASRGSGGSLAPPSLVCVMFIASRSHPFGISAVAPDAGRRGRVPSAVGPHRPPTRSRGQRARLRDRRGRRPAGLGSVRGRQSRHRTRPPAPLRVGTSDVGLLTEWRPIVRLRLLGRWDIASVLLRPLGSLSVHTHTQPWRKVARGKQAASTEEQQWLPCIANSKTRQTVSQ